MASKVIFTFILPFYFKLVKFNHWVIFSIYLFRKKITSGELHLNDKRGRLIYMGCSLNMFSLSKAPHMRSKP